MKKRQWYACKLKEKLMRFAAGEIVYVRRLNAKVPLAGGPCFILFRMKNPFSIRFFESMGVRNILSMWPDNFNPMPAPEEKNAEIEAAYQAWLEINPPAQRHDPAEKKRIAELMDKLKGTV